MSTAAFEAAEWPLVGRPGEMRLLAELITGERAGGIVLAGPPGVGKTRLANEALALAAAAGLPTARASATRASAGLAFGAVASLLPADDWSPAGRGGGLERADLLPRFAAALAERAGGRRLVLLVDDAHLLDNASATLVYQLAQSGTTLLLVTVRTGERAPDPVLALWKDGLLQRLELNILDGGALDDLLTAVLGGPVDPAAVVRLAARCQGNVLFLRELVLGALGNGGLSSDDGLWRLAGPLVPTGRLVELVESRLAGLDDDERALLEVVAIAEPLGAGELCALADLGTAERLERRALLASHNDGRRLEFGLVHPLHGEVLRAGISALRHRNIARALAEATESRGARRAEDQLRIAGWRLDSGGASPEAVLDAARAASARYDFAMAEHLARAAVQAGAGFPASLLAAQMTSLGGRGAEAEAELAVMATGAPGDAELAQVAAVRMDNLRFMGRFDAAATVAAAAEAEVSQPLARAEIAARRAGLLLETEGPAAAAEAARALIGGTHPASLGGSVVAGLALVRLGRLDDAAAACAAGRAATAPDRASPDWWPPALLELARAEALAQSGALAAAEALAADEHRRAVAVGVLDVQAFAAWQLARVLLLRGRVTAAVRHGREAAALLRQLGRPLLWQHSLVTLVTAEALRGRPGAALEILAEVDASGLPPSHGSSVDLLAGRAWASVAGGDLSTARQYLAEAADLAVAIGDRVGEASALHDQARLGGAPAVADRLAQVVAGIDGALAPARLEHTQALARGDGDRLLTVSDALEALGAWLLAAEAASDAAVALRRDREPRRAAAAQRRAAELGGRCEGVTTPALRAVESRALLTQAERDVASLAAAGRSNREIATALYLSLRTVENRLYRIYEKLGISGRSELADAWEGS